MYSRCYDRVSEQIANHRGVTLDWHQMNTGFVSGLPVCWGLNAAGYGAVYDAVARKVRREEGCGGLLWIPALLKSCEIFAEDGALVARLEASARHRAERLQGRLGPPVPITGRRGTWRAIRPCGA